MYFYFLVVLLLMDQAFSSTSHVLFKRDAPLVTVDIPLTVNKDQRYVVGVNMSSSADTQIFKFVLAANTGYSAVAGTACNDCNNVPAYNSSLSSSQRSFPGSKNLTIGSSSIIGPFIKENCGLHEVNGSAWQYPNQTSKLAIVVPIKGFAGDIIVANSSNLFSDVTSGLIGLGTNANGQSGDFFDTVYGGWLTRNPTQNNFSFGMALQAPDFTSDDDLGNGGILHWVVPDSSAYVGDVTWNNASVALTAPDESGASDTVANSALGLPEGDWRIAMDGWSASINSSFLSRSPNAFAYIEPYYSAIYFPESEADALYASITGATKLDNLVDGKQVWQIPCDTDLTISFTFAGTSFPVGADRLVINQDGICTGVVQAFNDQSVNDFILGSSFISTQYLIYVIGRPGSGVPNSIGIAQRSTQTKKHVGAIVGGTVGGVTGLVILLVIAFCLGRRYSWKQDRTARQRPMSEKYGSEGGKDSQLVSQSLMDNGSPKQSIFTTPPQSAFTEASFRPLLPEAQSPQSPAFSGLPSSPSLQTNHLSAKTPVPSLVGHGSSIISYNNAALGANVGAGSAAGGYNRNSMSTNSSEPVYGISPYILPQQPQPSASQTSMSRPRDVKTWRPPQEEQLIGPPSLRNIDPLSPSSGAATVEPFVLGPVPPTARVFRGNSKDSGPPPYSAGPGVQESRMNSLHSPGSATLVEYAPTTEADRTDRSQQQLPSS